MARPSTRGLFAVLLATSLLPACFAGERPSLIDDQSPTLTGDAAVDAVLERLDTQASGPLTASYTVVTKFLGAQTSAVVAIATDAGHSVTIGDVRYLTGPSGSFARTCSLATETCVDGIDETKVSDTLLTSTFFASAPAARLRQDFEVRTGPPVASTETIAGQAATCVAVPVTGGTKTYCALDSGVVARMDTADLSIELTDYTSSIDRSSFEESASLPG